MDPKLTAFQTKLNSVLEGSASCSSFTLDTAMQGCHLKMIAGFDELLCLPLVNIEKLNYQIGTARKVLGRMKGRGILADEVGLGKSVEAGLILKETMVRSMVTDALILVPPSLVSQWQEELESKFGIVSRLVRQGSKEEWQAKGVLVASIAQAKREVHASVLSERMFDIIIVDEAHHLRNRTTALWRLATRLKSKYLLFLTATPVQNSLDDLFNLVTLLKPGQLDTSREFKARFAEKGSRGLSVKNMPELKSMLKTVMVRNTRAEAGIELPPRQARTIVLEPSKTERELYERVSSELKKRDLNRMALLTAQRMMGSLLPCVFPLMEEMKISADTQNLAPSTKLVYLKSHIENIWREKPGEKIIIFTQFIETHRRLVECFQIFGPAVIIGGQDQSARDKEVFKFSAEASLMVSTDAGAEGRNLQFCHYLINFDIPWNPMRLEQRMGRLHRFGQKETVQILNLCTRGSIEEALLDLLDRKLNLFELVIGELSSILGDIEQERGFEEQVGDFWLESTSMKEFREKLDGIALALVQSKEQTAAVRKFDEAIFHE